MVCPHFCPVDTLVPGQGRGGVQPRIGARCELGLSPDLGHGQGWDSAQAGPGVSLESELSSGSGLSPESGFSGGSGLRAPAHLFLLPFSHSAGQYLPPQTLAGLRRKVAPPAPSPPHCPWGLGRGKRAPQMAPGPHLQLHLHILPGGSHMVQVLAGGLHLAAVAAVDEEPEGRTGGRVMVARTMVRQIWVSVQAPPLPRWSEPRSPRL